MTVTERKDAHLLIVFLNTYNDFETALKYIRRDWLSLIYPLPCTSATNYDAIKSGRYKTMERLKRIYSEYIMQVA